MTDSVLDGDATALVKAIAKGARTSREVLEAQWQCVEARNPGLNAVVAFDIESARRRADEADAAVARGDRLGPLHGLPITLKDTWEVPGMPCVAGAPEYRDHRPTTPAVAVQRLLDAGAIVFGKTNVPYMASDIQSFNAVYGTTRHPLNPDLTPGGSSGGAAAALAAGFTSLELGSDLAGSIRIPAHYCGVFGHKATYNVIPMRGHVPGPPGTLSVPPMAVAGPMARSARDLRLMMDIIADPGRPRAPQRKSLAGMRMLLWVDDAFCPIDTGMRALYEGLAETLRRAGVDVSVGGPAGIALEDVHRRYLRTLGSMMGVPLPSMHRQVMGVAGTLVPWLAPVARWAGQSLPAHLEEYLKGVDMRYAEVRRMEEGNLRLGAKVDRVFDQYDVILMPPAPTTAIPHNQHPALPLRRIQINGASRHYMELFTWIALASLLGLPATSMPVGHLASGMPVNIQIVGRHGQDATPLWVADKLSALLGG